MEGRSCLRIALIPRPVVLPGHVYILKEVQIGQGPVERVRRRLAEQEFFPYACQKRISILDENRTGLGRN